MSFWKQREAVAIVASLKQWHFRNEHTVVGVLHNSTQPKEYPDGERYTFMNMDIQAYPESAQYGTGHFIATSQTGKSFRCNINDRIYT